MKRSSFLLSLLLLFVLPARVWSQPLPIDSFPNLLRIRVENAVMNGNYQAATRYLEEKQDLISKDTAYSDLLDALGNLYLLQQEWQKIYDLYKDHYFAPSDDSTLLTMSRYLRDKPRMKLDAGKGSAMKFKPSISGTPIISVVVNGKTYRFWVDSGAGMSVLTASVARACGIRQFSGVNATAATGLVIDIGYGLIDSLRTGSLRVSNLPCLVLGDKQLEFRLAGIKIVDIDGIIGWNLLQELDVTIDHKLKQITFGPSSGKPRPGNPLCWMGVPIVLCNDSLHTPHYFTFDTGANNSAAYPLFAQAYDTAGTYYKSVALGSAGGTTRVRSLTYPRVVLFAGGQKLEMHNLGTDPSLSGRGLLSPDGVLGNKELGKYVLHYDLRGGVFELK
jgi:hypothetical protein